MSPLQYKLIKTRIIQDKQFEFKYLILTFLSINGEYKITSTFDIECDYCKYYDGEPLMEGTMEEIIKFYKK